MTNELTIDLNIVQFVANQLNLNQKNVAAVLLLSVTQASTIPFISRYRKEMTGGMDEVQIQKIIECHEEYVERENRRAFILDTLKKAEKLTPELQKDIMKASTLAQLEDLYAPYKTKKKSKGQMAIEAGLAPLATLIIEGKLTLAQIEKLASEQYLSTTNGIEDVAKALEGARSIILEIISHNLPVKQALRQQYWSSSIMTSHLRKGADSEPEATKYKDYFEFSQRTQDLKEEKNSHRYLAMRRGLAHKILKVEIEFNQEQALSTILQHWPEWNAKGACASTVREIAEKAYQHAIHPSLDLEMKADLKKIADEFAIKVFGENLKNLLLAPYLGARTLVGIDPGIRSGCKIVVIADSGKLEFDTIINPHSSPAQAAVVLNKLCEHFKVQYIAIGNGTYGRETLEFVEENITMVKEKKTTATLVSEAGASVYSASEIAREEFPDKDVTVRGAISIARRFQDPLAELVKIDPKSIGVGQYQHDINQARLKKSLEQVVENCVNYVGVDVNTASPSLLSYVSGIGPAVAKKITAEREKKGRFKSRQDLLKVAGMGAKVYEQCAGFLRVHDGTNPLDATFIHPERYHVIEEWLLANKKNVADLLCDKELVSKLESDQALKKNIGEFTHADIVKSLKAPKQDPRTEFKSTEFRKDTKKIEDIKIGEWYPGVVTNITNFGAFVDIGIKENGLLHISQISDQFITDPLQALKVGEEVKVKIMEVDMIRKRISLTRKTNTQIMAGKPAISPPPRSPQPPRQQANDLKNNAFAALKDVKWR